MRLMVKGTCLEVHWHRPGVFDRLDTPARDWQAVLDTAAAIRLLERIDRGTWSAIYEVDVVRDGDVLGDGGRRTAQFLVCE